MRLQQHRNIEVGGATLECTICGSGTPVVLLANAGCSTGYFDDLVRVLAAGGLQAISVNMRGTGGSRGSLDGITVHDLAADVVFLQAASLDDPSMFSPQMNIWTRSAPPWHHIDSKLPSFETRAG